ncbi:hypothetical protein [Microbacterium mangrovi]|nr:hypothetical protein [Microbacterium mangrovi]
MKGAVQFRLTDVSGSSGRRWNHISFEVWLIDASTGASYGSAVLSKRWGVATAYKTVGFVPNGRSVRLRTRLNIFDDSLGSMEVSGTWAGDIRWDNSNAS